MAYENFGFPSGGAVEGLTIGTEPDHLIDLTMFETTLNFAFTDFDSSATLEVERNGRTYSDTEATVVCIQGALADGVPLLDGKYLATITRWDLERRIISGDMTERDSDEEIEIRAHTYAPSPSWPMRSTLLGHRTGSF